MPNRKAISRQLHLIPVGNNKRFLVKKVEQPEMILKFGITEVANYHKFTLINCQSLSKTSRFTTSLKWRLQRLYLDVQRSTIQHQFFVKVGSVNDHISSRQKEISSENFSHFIKTKTNFFRQLFKFSTRLNQVIE